MKNYKIVIEHLKTKDYYVKLLDLLVLNGLLDIFDEEIKDGKIDYLPLIVNVITFLSNNKKLYKNFTTDTFEKIIILSVDEILTKKFNLEIEDDKLELALILVKNSWIFETMYSYVKDLFVKLYYKINCNCKNTTDVIEPKNVNLELDRI
jgi:hypothetical protein